MASEEEIRRQINDLYEAYRRREITKADYNLRRKEILRNGIGIQKTTNTGNNAAACNTDKADKYKCYKMGWHKFLIYFGLWAAALLYVTIGINYITGKAYLSQGYDTIEQVEKMYRIVKGLKIADVIYGAILIGLGALAIVTRFRLAGLKKKAPMMLWILNGVSLAVGIIFNIIQYNLNKEYMSVKDTNLFGAGLVGSVLPGAILLIINVFYYKNRKELFE